MGCQAKVLQALATSLQSEPPGKGHRTHVANLATLVVHAVVLTTGHANGLTVIIQEKVTKQKGEKTQNNGVEEAAEKYHQAENLAEKSPADVQAQVEAVMAWTWLQQEVQRFQEQPWEAHPPAKYREAVEQGGQEVQMWLTKAMRIGQPILNNTNRQPSGGGTAIQAKSFGA